MRLNDDDDIDRIRQPCPQGKLLSNGQIDPSVGCLGASECAVAPHVFRPGLDG